MIPYMNTKTDQLIIVIRTTVITAIFYYFFYYHHHSWYENIIGYFYSCYQLFLILSFLSLLCTVFKVYLLLSGDIPILSPSIIIQKWNLCITLITNTLLLLWFLSLNDHKEKVRNKKNGVIENWFIFYAVRKIISQILYQKENKKKKGWSEMSTKKKYGKPTCIIGDLGNISCFAYIEINNEIPLFYYKLNNF